jgi:hypothetical protein
VEEEELGLGFGDVLGRLGARLARHLVGPELDARLELDLGTERPAE